MAGQCDAWLYAVLAIKFCDGVGTLSSVFLGWLNLGFDTFAFDETLHYLRNFKGKEMHCCTLISQKFRMEGIKTLVSLHICPITHVVINAALACRECPEPSSGQIAACALETI